MLIYIFLVISSQGDEVKEDVLIKEFLSTSEGGTVAIKAFTEVLDDDVDENMFVYVITVKPKYGIIQKNGKNTLFSINLLSFFVLTFCNHIVLLIIL